MEQKLTPDARELEVLLKEADGRHLVERVMSVSESPAVAAGENFLGEISRLRMEVVLRTGRRAVRSLIIKKCARDKNNPLQYQSYLNTMMREVKIYKEVLPGIEEVFDEYEDFDEKNWCEFYGFDKKGMIILQDLKLLRYTTGARRGMGLAEAELVLRGIARFHAATRVLLDDGTIKPQAYPPQLLVTDSRFTRTLAVTTFKNLAGLIKAEWGPEWQEVGERLDRPVDELAERILELGRVDFQRPLTLQHGDLWTNNILLRRDLAGRPVGLKLIDYQLCLCTHHITWDLVFYLYTSVEREARRREEGKLIAVYHEALRHYMGLYKRPQEEIPTLQDILRDLKEIGFWKVLVTVFNYGFFSCEEVVGLDFPTVVKTGGKRGFDLDMYRRPFYKEDVGNDLKIFMKEGII